MLFYDAKAPNGMTKASSRDTVRNILEDSYKLVKHFPDFLLWEYRIKSFLLKKQICTPRAENPGNVLLTSRNHLKYFYQCTWEIFDFQWKIDFRFPNNKIITKVVRIYLIVLCFKPTYIHTLGILTSLLINKSEKAFSSVHKDCTYLLRYL